MKIKATKTGRYAQHQPYLPQFLLMDGVTYDLPDRLAHRVISLDGAQLVVEEGETPEDSMPSLEMAEDTVISEPKISRKRKGR